MKTITILSIAVVLGIVLHMRAARARQRRIREAFSGREPQTDQQFFEHHFQSEGIPLPVVTGVRRVLEECLDADLSGLAATDDFSKNLSFFWRYDSMADVEIVLALEKEFGIEIADEEATAARTVRDIVELVWSKKRPAEPPPREGGQ